MSSEKRKNNYVIVSILIIVIAGFISFFENKQRGVDDDLITAALTHGPTDNCLWEVAERPCYMTIAVGPKFVIMGPGAENAYRTCLRNPYIKSEFLAKTPVCERERVHVCYESRAREILFLNGECV